MRGSGSGRVGTTGPGAAALALLCASLVASAGSSQERLTEHTYTRPPDTPTPSARVEDMAWLAGHWVGEGLGGTVEEIWSPPLGGAMMGMFRLVKDGETAFYELMTLAPSDGRLTLRVKHFNRDLTGWEDREKSVDFPLVEVADGAFRFEGLTFHPEGRDRLNLHLAMHQRDGSVREETLSYQRFRPHGQEP